MSGTGDPDRPRGRNNVAASTSTSGSTAGRAPSTAATQGTGNAIAPEPTLIGNAVTTLSNAVTTTAGRFGNAVPNCNPSPMQWATWGQRCAQSAGHPQQGEERADVAEMERTAPRDT
jgi:hypothetical protein